MEETTSCLVCFEDGGLEAWGVLDLEGGLLPIAKFWVFETPSISDSIQQFQTGTATPKSKLSTVNLWDKNWQNDKQYNPPHHHHYHHLMPKPLITKS